MLLPYSNYGRINPINKAGKYIVLPYLILYHMLTKCDDIYDGVNM